MGIDIYGKVNGSYLGHSWWSWRPLWRYVLQVAPWVGEMVVYGQSNDGDGLDGEHSSRLARELRVEISTGRCCEFVMFRDKALDAMPDEPCQWCKATGVRTDEVGVANGMPERFIGATKHPRNGQRGWCNGCDGVGSVRPSMSHYRFTVGDVVEFCEFLEKCGGFEIH